MNITANKIQDFLGINRSTNSYAYDLDYEFEWDTRKQKPIDLKKQSETVLKNAKEDLKYFFNAANEYEKREGFKIGAKIELPDGSHTYITHVWSDTVQTGNQGSCFLSKCGHISRSGGLDSGLKKSDLILTEKTDKILVWFWHMGWSGANRGVNYYLPVQVYKTKKGCDLSGIPQIAENKRQKLIAKSETITRINGNGQPYTMHMPELRIIKPHPQYTEKIKDLKSFVLAGLRFDVMCNGIAKCQPMKKAEIDKLLSMYDFKGTFYNNCGSKNTLYLEDLNQCKGYNSRYTKLI